MTAISLSTLDFDTRGLLSGAYWGELRIFAEVARAKSFNKAAENLALSQPTVGRKVRRLQEVIGTQLFVSTRQGVRLTRLGEELAKALLVFDQSLYSTTADLKARDKDVDSIVRVNITDGLATFFAAPALPAFERAHPRIKLHLRGIDAFSDLRDNQTDMMLTVVPLNQPDTVCRRLGTLTFVPIASSAYLDRFGTPTQSNVAQHHFLQSHVYESGLPAFSGWAALCASGQVSHRCDSSVTYAMLVKQGLGIGLLASYASTDRDAVVCDLGVRASVQMYGIALAERLTQRPVRLVFDWMCAIFGSNNRWFGPERPSPTEDKVTAPLINAFSATSPKLANH